VRKVAATGKPVIISTGMATQAELDETVREARAAGCRELVLLKCTSTYPASPECSNLRTIPDLRERYQCEVGLSDHTAGIGAAVAAVALGATVIEKHFTLSRAEGGVDSAFSLEPLELAALVEETGRAWLALGEVSYGPSGPELKSLVFRRSLYVVQDLRAGDVLTPENLRAIRPGLGLPPRHIDELLGRRVAHDIARGTPMSWDLLRDT
jgi:N-acetylneuraminate synthase